MVITVERRKVVRVMISGVGAGEDEGNFSDSTYGTADLSPFNYN